MVWWQVILFPFAILYNLVTRFRNHLFNIGYTPSFEFEVNTIVVGNLSVGGTGKSPMVSYLIEKLAKQYSTATLSRGYGRKTKGFFVAEKGLSPKEVGDEPYMFFQKHGQEIIVSVGEDRAYAIPSILYEAPETQLILLDDGFQHRSVKANFNLLLTRYDHPFYEDFLLPAGRLRESRSEAKRADAIVVTKCPEDLEQVRKDELKKHVGKYTEANVYFTTVTYEGPVPFVSTSQLENVPKKYIVVVGIANNDDFIRHCQSTYLVKEVFTFSDHHAYAEKDIQKISASLSADTGLLTTEKDWVKLNSVKALQGFACYYVPITTTFLEEEEKFLEEVKNSLKEYSHESFVQPQDH